MSRLRLENLQKDDLRRRIAGIIRRRRRGLRMKQAELADKASLSRTSIVNIESGNQECSLVTFVGIAIALDSQPADLLAEIWRPLTTDGFAQKVLLKAK